MASPMALSPAPGERMTLPAKRKGHKHPAAEICLYATPRGWTHSIRYSWEEGGGGYAAGTCHSGFCPTRAGALALACSRITRDGQHDDTPEWRRIGAWLATLAPDVAAQGNLFWRAA